jgi:hypothetical protein
MRRWCADLGVELCTCLKGEQFKRTKNIDSLFSWIDTCHFVPDTLTPIYILSRKHRREPKQNLLFRNLISILPRTQHQDATIPTSRADTHSCLDESSSLCEASAGTVYRDDGVYEDERKAEGGLGSSMEEGWTYCHDVSQILCA